MTDSKDLSPEAKALAPDAVKALRGTGAGIANPPFQQIPATIPAAASEATGHGTSAQKLRALAAEAREQGFDEADILDRAAADLEKMRNALELIARLGGATSTPASRILEIAVTEAQSVLRAIG